MLKHVNKVDFENSLTEKKILVVDFFATWCGPCQMLGPVLEELAKDMPEIDVLKIDIDEEQELAIKEGIEVVPTLIIYKNGEKKNIIQGLRSKSELVQEINKVKE